jgi:RHS repeat-associated protein
MAGHRPADWHVLDLDKDPTPGDPQRVRTLAKQLHDFADDVSDALRLVKGMAGEGTLLEWAGKSADVFKEDFADVPKNLKKLKKSYEMCGDALADFWPKLERAQSLADKALRKGREARDSLSSAQSRLTSADSWVTRAGKEADKYKDDPTGSKSDADKPDEAKVRAATRDVQHAKSAQSKAQSDVSDAQDALAAAKKMAEDARKMRDEAAREAKSKIDEASDAGIQNRSWWEEVGDWFTDNWDSIVAVCKVVVAVVGIVAMIIGGPILGAIVLIAAAVVLADTLYKYSKGQASLWDVGFAALDCIPGMKGLTTLGGLAKGMKGLAKVGLKGMAKGLGSHLRKSALSMLKRTCKNDPIDVVTGEMVMSEDDVFLPGVLPLILRRHYVTDQRAGRWFGRSWTSTLDQRLILEQFGVRLVTEDGMVLEYPTPERDLAVMPVEGPRWELSWDGTAASPMIVHQSEIGQELHFAQVTPHRPAELSLVSMTDRHGNSIEVSYNEQGVPFGVSHSGGYRIDVAVVSGRITEFSLASAPDTPTLCRYGYDRKGRLTHVSDASGHAEKLFYDEEDRISGWEDRIGTVFRYTYDAQGRCLRTTGPDGLLSSTFQYDDAAGRTVYTDSLGHSTTYELNDHLQVVREIDPLGGTTLREWDRYDRLLSETDPLGRTTCYTYDGRGDLIEVRLPDNTTVGAEYDEEHQPVTLVEADGARWQRGYDERGRLSRMVNPMGATTRFSYDERGARSLVIDPQGASYEIVNDAAGLPETVIDALGHTTRYERNALGQVVRIIDANGAVTSLVWTPEGRLLERRLADGSAEFWQHDAAGNPITFTSAAGAVTRYEQGPFGLPVAVTGPDGSRIEYAYDTELRLTTVTNALGQSWSYTYDAAGRLVCERDFSGRETTYGYDAAGQPVERINGAGQRLVCAFDARGNLLRQATDDGVIHYRYDRAGRLMEAAGPDAVISYERDGLGAVLRETCNGRSLELDYDLMGRRIRRRTPSGAETAWEYDAGHRLTALHTQGISVQLAYDPMGRETERRLGAAALLSQSWDAVGRTTRQVLYSAGRTHGSEDRGVEVWRRTYGFRPDNVLTDSDDSVQGHHRFTLDAHGRVLTANSPRRQEHYAYDAVGNLANSQGVPEPGGQAGAPSVDRDYEGLLLRRSGRTRYAYDGQGRVVSVTRRLLSGGSRTWQYRWDAFDRLTDVITPDDRRWHYLYDPHGRRIAKQLLAQDGTVIEQTDFTWEGTRLAERIQPQGDGASRATTWHWQPGEHRPLAQTEQVFAAADGSAEDQEEIDARFYAIVTDLIGTPTELVDDDGRFHWRRSTSVWGVPFETAGEEPACPLGFPGQYHDLESGLDYNVRRYYDAENARYISPDPLGLDAAPNNYAYVPNPFTWSDPFGLVCTDLGGWYGRLSPARKGNEINHIPAKAAYAHLSLTDHMGPAIRMERRDHRLVSSTDSRGYSATPWRNAQRDLIDQGKFDEAMKMDIDDIRARFGTKYDQHIADMVASLKDNAGLQKMLSDNGWTINYDLLK